MKRSLWLALLALAAPFCVSAEVADSAAGGFTSKTTLTIKAPPVTVDQHFLEVPNWWSSEHAYSGDAKNLSMEAKPMGCWCEKLPNDGAVRHIELSTPSPGKYLVLSGGLGPLQSIAATGTMKITFASVEGGTKFEVTYMVAGYVPAGMNTWAAPVDGVLTEQLNRFKSYAETGSAASRK